MTTRQTQLHITIPDGVPPGSELEIPIKGGLETIKARVPEGLGPGSTLVLTQLEGSDEWVEERLEETTQLVSPPRSDPLPEQETVLDVDVDGITPAGPVAYTVRLDTNVGVIDIIVRPDWAPHGARRFLDLAKAGDLDGLSFYRAVKGCLAQFGLPAKRQWPPLPDDPPTGVPFLLGAVCFAAVGKNSRKSTLFICVGDMSHCFGQSPWETPIGAVAETSLDALDRIDTSYGDIAECGGEGPDTGLIHQQGNEYLRSSFPRLSYIRWARPLDWPPAAELPAEPSPRLKEDAHALAVQAAQAAQAAAQVAQAAQAVAAVFQEPISQEPSQSQGCLSPGQKVSSPSQPLRQQTGQPLLQQQASQQPQQQVKQTASTIDVPVEVLRMDSPRPQEVAAAMPTLPGPAAPCAKTMRVQPQAQVRMGPIDVPVEVMPATRMQSAKLVTNEVAPKPIRIPQTPAPALGHSGCQSPSVPRPQASVIFRVNENG